MDFPFIYVYINLCIYNLRIYYVIQIFYDIYKAYIERARKQCKHFCTVFQIILYILYNICNTILYTLFLLIIP